MKRTTGLMVAVLATSVVSMASAQEARLDVPQPEHGLLERLAGEWSFERRSVPADGSKPEVLGEGTISAEMVGPFFVVSRWAGNVYGWDYHAIQSLGYDIERTAYTGQWIDSFMSYTWELIGQVDDESQELILATSGPAPAGGTVAFRERYRFDSPGSITIVGEMQQGEHWVPFTSTRLTRRR
jgi:hypothetical protein